MSLRNKPMKKAITEEELSNMQRLAANQFKSELGGTVAGSDNDESAVYFKEGDNKGMRIRGGETSFEEISSLDPTQGTATSIKYKGKNGEPRKTSTIITADKRLLDEQGNEIRQLY